MPPAWVNPRKCDETGQGEKLTPNRWLIVHLVGPLGLLQGQMETKKGVFVDKP